MIWWHEAQFALWNRSNLLDRTLGWYEKVEPIARQIAQRQGFDGVRWMKMTDPSGTSPFQSRKFSDLATTSFNLFGRITLSC